MTKKDFAALFACYLMWGFQPLYWNLIDDVDSLTILAVRIILAALFSALLLICQHRLGELKRVLCDRSIMKLLVPAVVFLLLDWAVFIIVVNSGHILDASIGYYINPLLLFLAGVLVYKERCEKSHIFALCLAAIGVLVSTVAFGSFPYISLIIAVNWAVYAIIKKNVKLDGVLSIAAETAMLSIPALLFLIFFRSEELMHLPAADIAVLSGSGIITALPMFLYSRSVSRLPLIFMCFAQYLSPTFNLICGLITGESFSSSQLVSFAFFIAAIIIFTITEVRKNGNTV